MFVNQSEQNEQSLQRTFHRCFLLSFGSFGQAVSKEKIYKNRPIRNKNCLWRPCLLMDRDEMSNLYRGPFIDASYHVSVHLTEGFERRRLKCEKLTDDGRRMPSDGKSSHCLWQGELKSNKTIWMFYRKFFKEGDNTVGNPNIYYVEDDNRLSPGLQPLKNESVLKILFFQSCSIIVYYYTRNQFVYFFVQNKTF